MDSKQAQKHKDYSLTIFWGYPYTSIGQESMSICSTRHSIVIPKNVRIDNITNNK